MNNHWDGVYGQESVKLILDKIIHSNKIPHAFLFQGNSGTGKDLLAIRFAQALNQNESVNSKIQNLSEPYIKYIFPLPRGKNETESSGPVEKLSEDEIKLLQEELEKKINNPYYKIVLPKANFIKISSIRDIKKFLSISYSDVKFRIVLISDAHLMNEEAQNALLKNLEEPPEGVIFILTTPYPDNLRETIRSRCWRIAFEPLSESDLSEILSKYFNVGKKFAEEIAPFSAGSVNMALKLMEHDFQQLREKTIFILRYSFGRKYHSALDQFAPFIKDNDTDSIKLLIQMIIIWLNDIQRHKIETGNYFYSTYLDTLEKFNKKFPEVEINELVYKLDRLSSMIHNNININLLVLNIIFELAALTSNFNK